MLKAHPVTDAFWFRQVDSEVPKGMPQRKLIRQIKTWASALPREVGNAALQAP